MEVEFDLVNFITNDQSEHGIFLECLMGKWEIENTNS